MITSHSGAEGSLYNKFVRTGEKYRKNKAPITLTHEHYG